jgi:alanine dehydrogenase
MIIGVPSETHRHEHRVGLAPFAVARLTQQGHTVLIERGAGLEAHFTEQDYQRAGAQIVHSSEEAYKRPDMVCRVSTLTPGELDLLKPGTIICGFHHLAVTPKTSVERLMMLETTLIGYEIIRDWDGNLPVLTPFSEIGGHMVIHIAARYLQTEAGGRGILLGNIPGVPPPTVLILGAGTVGHVAAEQAVAAGAHVIVLDVDLRKLRALDREFKGQIVTVMAGVERLEQFTAIADVIIGSVLVPGARAPWLVTEEMVRAMKPGSVIVDVSIDQGGSVETSRPTTLDNPVYKVHDVLHYCVPNITANVPRTASRALANAALPYLQELAGRGVEASLKADPGLASGVYLYQGKMVNERVGETLGIPVTPLKL